MKIYVFIDAQNLHLNIKHQGWELDYEKFLQYLKDKYKVKKVFLFIGWIKTQKHLYKRLRAIGYILVFKETSKYIQNGKICYKGNVDAELVLHCAKIEFFHYDKAIVISGDGDFKCLIRYLEENNKLQRILIPSKFAYSSLLFPYRKYMDFLSDQKQKLGI